MDLAAPSDGGMEMPTAPRSQVQEASDVVVEEGWSVLRTLNLHEGEITLVAVKEGSGWKATVEGSPSFQGLEFHGRMPKVALDQAESFVRRLLAPPSPG